MRRGVTRSSLLLVALSGGACGCTGTDDPETDPPDSDVDTDETDVPEVTMRLRVLNLVVGPPSFLQLDPPEVFFAPMDPSTSTDYVEVPAGVYRIQLRTAETQRILFDFHTELLPDAHTTIVGYGPLATAEHAVLDDDLDPPEAGFVRIQLFHAHSPAGEGVGVWHHDGTTERELEPRLAYGALGASHLLPATAPLGLGLDLEEAGRPTHGCPLPALPASVDPPIAQIALFSTPEFHPLALIHLLGQEGPLAMARCEPLDGPPPPPPEP